MKVGFNVVDMSALRITGISLQKIQC